MALWKQRVLEGNRVNVALINRVEGAYVCMDVFP